jgi:hypothetical protein
MDQDDTFRVLRQQPFDEVFEKLSMRNEFHGNISEFWTIIEGSGWTREEWSKELGIRTKYG